MRFSVKKKKKRNWSLVFSRMGYGVLETKVMGGLTFYSFVPSEEPGICII